MALRTFSYWVLTATFGWSSRLSAICHQPRTRVDGNVFTFQALDDQHVLVLGTDGKLWLEQAPFGKVPPSRTQVDGSVKQFHQVGNTGDIFVLGNDGNLWLEQGPSGPIHYYPSILGSCSHRSHG